MSEDTQKLIRMVEERPILWDRTNDMYKSRSETKEAWRSICAEFDKSFDEKPYDEKRMIEQELIKKWTNVKDSWLKWYRKNEESKKFGGGIPKLRKYIYHDKLLFLHKLVENQDDQYENLQEDKSLESFYTEIPCEVAIKEESDKKILRKTPLSKESLTGEMLTLNVDRLRNKRKETASPESQWYVPDDKKTRWLSEFEPRIPRFDEVERIFEDPHLSFFRGIIPSIRNFNQTQVIDFQLGVLQLIKNISASNSSTS